MLGTEGASWQASAQTEKCCPGVWVQLELGNRQTGAVYAWKVQPDPGGQIKTQSCVQVSDFNMKPRTQKKKKSLSVNDQSKVVYKDTERHGAQG